MGYTHYWKRPRLLDQGTFAKAAQDCETIARFIGVPLADGQGRGDPQFTPARVRFNGREDCGHPGGEVGIAWPAEGAEGIALEEAPKVAGRWLGGARLATRSCDGHCAHDTFQVEPRYQGHSEPDQNGRYFAFCKTAFKPYDLTVQACLIVFAHHVPGETSACWIA